MISQGIKIFEIADTDVIHMLSMNSLLRNINA